MWKIYVNISCVQLIAYSIIAAQGYVPSSSPQNSNTQMNYGASSNSGLFESQNFQNMAQKLLIHQVILWISKKETFSGKAAVSS